MDGLLHISQDCAARDGEQVSFGLDLPRRRTLRAPIDCVGTGVHTGTRVRVRPGSTVREVNAVLAPYGRKLGPDPASESACTLGGVIADNSSGMHCGTEQNTYRTLESMVMVLPSGTVLDTADHDADRQLREAEPELIERVLDRFEEVRLVDDAAFAEVWVRSRHRSKGLARRALGHELQQKGVDREIAAEALEAIDGEDERAAALDLVRRRLRGRTVPGGASPEARAERDKVTRRLVGMLGRKGYGGGLAFAVVKEVLAEHEE